MGQTSLSLVIFLILGISHSSVLAQELCNQSFAKLELNLLSNSLNRFNLLRTFYPARDSHPVFVHVNYTYIDAANSTTVPDTHELWYWTMSAFYLIQPLEVFQFTSLLFANRPSREGHLVVQLDRECLGADPLFLEMLTQRVKGEGEGGGGGEGCMQLAKEIGNEKKAERGGSMERCF